MPPVMTKSATVTCPHGIAVVVTGAPMLVVGNEEVLTAAGVEGAAVAACPGNQGAGKCTKCESVTTGKATKLEVNGSPVLLAGFAVSTNGVPPTAVVVPSPPNKLEAI